MRRGDDLQQANVHAILESDSKVANVRDSLNDALALLDDVNENLATFDTKLLVMREDIAAIEVCLRLLRAPSVNAPEENLILGKREAL